MKRILIVDDEEVYREAVGAVLRQAGYLVSEAEDGEKAIDVALNVNPDLIISDVMMDGLDGYGFLDRLRMDPSTSMIPFVFMTGLSDKESMRKGMSRGADDFLVKPFSADDLTAAIEMRLEKHSQMVVDAEKKLSQLRTSITLALPHEIRSPLTSILGFADVLSQDGAILADDEVIQSGQLIQKAGLRLQRLMENFMIYSQIEVFASDPDRMAAFKKSMTPNPGDLIKSLSLERAESHRRAADLLLDLAPCPAAISDYYLKKICEELVDNAFKFSEAGTRVEVRTSMERRRFVLTIADSGRGMTLEQVASLGAYVQFERTYYEQQGTGLGLVIAKRLTEMHGGTMEFESNAQKGLIVHVRLPNPAEQE